MEPTQAPLPLDEAAVHQALEQVIDPEVGLDIENLGLVYGVTVDPTEVRVTLTMTTPACPMGPMIVEDARDAVAAIAGGRSVEVDLVWEPPWTPARMSDFAKQTLGWG